jgi:phage/conjugal plasmid C-4 type zinc finger TraR family protein
MNYRTTQKLLRSISEEIKEWLCVFSSTNQDRGDTSVRAHALAEVHRLYALYRLLKAQATIRQSRRFKNKRLVCLQCSNPIPRARRKAMPNAARCVKCQEEFERTRKTTRRLVCI